MYGPFWPGSALFQHRRQLFKHPLSCVGGQFISKGETPALNANSAKIGGAVFLRQGFKAEGRVDLTGATIQGNLECGGGQFASKGAIPALNANTAKIGGNVFLRQGFKAEGGVDLTGATIGGWLSCIGGQFFSKGETPALSAILAKIEGSVFLGCHFSQEYVKNDIVIFITGGQLSARCLSFHWLNIAERLSWITSSCAGRIRAHFAAGIG